VLSIFHEDAAELEIVEVDFMFQFAFSDQKVARFYISMQKLNFMKVLNPL
jgi:hypothetical protein